MYRLLFYLISNNYEFYFLLHRLYYTCAIGFTVEVWLGAMVDDLGEVLSQGLGASCQEKCLDDLKGFASQVLRNQGLVIITHIPNFNFFKL